MGNKNKTSVNISNIIKNKSITNDQLNIVRESINQIMTNTIKNAYTECTAISKNMQDISITNIAADGSVIIKNIDQNMEVTFKMDCKSTDSSQKEFDDRIQSQTEELLENSVDNNFKGELDAQVNASMESGWQPPTNIAGETNKEIDIKNIVTNTTVVNKSKDLKSFMKNMISSTLTSNVVNKCISKSENKQQLILSNITAGDDVIISDINQDMQAGFIAEFISDNKLDEHVANSTAKVLGVTIKDKTSNTSDISNKSKTDASVKEVGIIEEAFSGIAGVVSSLTSGMIIIIIGAVVIFFIYAKFGGNLNFG
jgi:hypothetical protein